MDVRGFALSVAAAGCCVALTGCGMLPGGGSADGGGSGKGEKAADGAAAGTWEAEFPEGITPIIEMDKPGGKAQEDALNEFFAFYGGVYTAVYEKDKDPEFLTAKLSEEAAEPDALKTAIAAFVDADAVPKGDVRFYNGLAGAFSETTVQVDFCVDQRPVSIVDGSGKEAEVGGPYDWQVDMLSPNISYASSMFEKDDKGTWKNVSFAIAPVKKGEADVNECLGEDEKAGEPS